MSPHTYSRLDRGCSHRFSHIHTIFAPYSHHIRAIFTRIHTVFAPHSHHIRTYSHTFAIGNDDDKGDDDDMDDDKGHDDDDKGDNGDDMDDDKGNDDDNKGDDDDDKGNDDDNKGDDDDDSFAGDSTRFVRFAPDSQDSHRIRTVFALYSHCIRTVFARIRTGSREGRGAFALIHTYSRTFIPILACECAKRASYNSHASRWPSSS